MEIPLRPYLPSLPAGRGSPPCKSPPSSLPFLPRPPGPAAAAADSSRPDVMQRRAVLSAHRALPRGATGLFDLHGDSTVARPPGTAAHWMSRVWRPCTGARKNVHMVPLAQKVPPAQGTPWYGIPWKQICPPPP